MGHLAHLIQRTGHFTFFLLIVVPIFPSSSVVRAFSWLQFQSGTQGISLSHACDMLNLILFLRRLVFGALVHVFVFTPQCFPNQVYLNL